MGEACLAELLTFTRDGEWGQSEPSDGYVPMQVVRGTDFEKVRFGDLTKVPVRYIREDIAERKQLQVGDVLLETAGGTKDQPTGRTVSITERTLDSAVLPLTCASFARFLRPDPQKIDSEYLFWKLQAEYASGQMLPFHIQHTGVARFQCTQFANSHSLSILDKVSEQRRQVAVLTTLDDKIELNRRMNETLEAMARAIFRDWFVDFGPARAKMQGGEPYLSQDLWGLFPDHLDDDGKPEGWDKLSLDQIAVFLNGLALQKYPADDGSPSLPVIKIAELRNGVTAKSNRASYELPEKYIVDDGDFLFSWSGSLLAKFWTEGKGALNQHLFKVTSDDFPAWFYAGWVHHHLEEFQSIAASKATTMGHIQRNHLKAAMTICPPAATLKAMGETVEPLVQRTIHNELENRTLSATRDLLLPKLMSGGIRVAEAEELAEEAVQGGAAQLEAKL